jgi:PHP family Zn ribbon phosphoesterase
MLLCSASPAGIALYFTPCRAIYAEFISRFGNEIAVLIDAPFLEIRAVPPNVADAISALEERDDHLAPGRREVRYVLACLNRILEVRLCTL